MVKKLFIWSFILLYLGIGIVSTVHSYEFFQLANLSWMAIVLACCFEIGQAATLFSIFNNADVKSQGGKLKRSEIWIPWVLMIVLTLVQIFGNLFSSYRFLDINNSENVPYFAIPVLSVFGIDITNEQNVKIIISYIMGAILPILALLLTAMVDSFIKRPNEIKNEVKYDHTQVDNGDYPMAGIVPNTTEHQNEPIETPNTSEQINNNTENNNPLEDIKNENNYTEIVPEPIPEIKSDPIAEPIIRTNGITIKR